MSKKRKIISLAVLGVLLLASLALSLLLGIGFQQYFSKYFPCQGRRTG